MRTLTATESQIQRAFIARIRIEEKRYPALRTLFAVPNGELRNIVVATRLKLEGVKPGVPDILLPIPMHKHCGLALEFKRSKYSRLSPAQLGFQSYLMMYGWRCETVWDHEQAWAIVKNYLKL